MSLPNPDGYNETKKQKFIIEIKECPLLNSQSDFREDNKLYIEIRLHMVFIAPSTAQENDFL